MKYLTLSLSLLFFLFYFGCSGSVSSPESTFKDLVESAKLNNGTDLSSFFSKESISTMNTRDPKWMRRLVDDTIKSNPRYEKTEWMVHNQIARVWFTHSDNQKDYLTMERDKQNWRIKLKGNTDGLPAALPDFKPESR
jgi:hypothetical protein